MSKSKPIGGGRWLPTPPEGHECKPPPILWGAKAGQRWQCARTVGTTPATQLMEERPVECGKVWIIREEHPESMGHVAKRRKVWRPELDKGPAVHVFREATPAEINYWLAEELDCQISDGGEFQPSEVIRALQKHFTIGVQS